MLAQTHFITHQPICLNLVFDELSDSYIICVTDHWGGITLDSEVEQVTCSADLLFHARAWRGYIRADEKALAILRTAADLHSKLWAHHTVNTDSLEFEVVSSN